MDLHTLSDEFEHCRVRMNDPQEGACGMEYLFIVHVCEVRVVRALRVWLCAVPCGSDPQGAHGTSDRQWSVPETSERTRIPVRASALGRLGA